MKIKIFLFLVLYIILSNVSFSQNYYEDSFPEMKDEKFYPIIDSCLSEGNFEPLISISDQAFSFYYNQNKIDTAIYLYNVSLYFPLAYGYIDVAFPNLLEKEKFLEQNIDTMNVHYATLLHIIAFCYKYIDDLENAIPYYQRAISIYENVETPDLHLYSAYQSFAPLFIYFGDFWTGYKMYQKALNGYKKDSTENEYFDYKKSHDIATIQMGIALAMQETGQNEFSFYFNKLAFEIFENQFSQSVNTAITAINISSDCIRLEDYEKALEFADISDSLFLEYNSKDDLFMVYLYILKYKGIANSKNGNFSQAEIIFSDYKKLIEKYYYEDSLVLYNFFAEYAEMFFDKENYDTAVLYFEKANSYFPENIKIKTEIAKCYSQNSEYQMAVDYLNQAFNQNLTGNNDFDIENFSANQVNDIYQGFLIAKDLASNYYKIFEQNNSFDELVFSVNYFNIANVLITKYISTVLIGTFDLLIAEDYHEFVSNSIKASYTAYDLTSETKYLNNILNLMSNSNSFNLNSEIGSSKLSQEQIAILIDIKKLENELLVAENDDNKIKIEEIKNQIFEKKLSAFELSHQLQNNENKINKIDLINDIQIADLQEKIYEESALISFHYSDEILYGICLTKDNFLIYNKKINDDFNNLLKKYYKSLKISSSDLFSTSSDLYNFLLSDFDKLLENKSNLIIIPDRELNQIPFDVFVKNDKYLIEKYSITYNYSIFLWYNRQNNIVPEEISFAGFAPVFNDENSFVYQQNVLRFEEDFEDEFSEIYRDNRLSPLLQSEKEVNEIKNLFDKKNMKAEVFINQKATEKNFVENSNGNTVLHIATHGYSSTKTPEFSGLFFYKSENVENSTYDGFLYLGEIFTLKTDANLVVLSACKSGSGKIAKGEGVLSLPRAFIFAGVPNIIASLWKIHDENTKNLMLDFYKFLLEGNSYSKSLQLAKIEQINKGELPIDWSALILIGN